jgi:uncharacterized protein YcfJ
MQIFTRSRFLAAIIVAMPILLVACSGQPLSTREKGTIAGGVIGAGSGAIIGAAVGAPGAGAAIGGAIGAGTGALIGNEFQNVEVAQHHTQSQISYQQSELEHQRREIDQLKQVGEVE